MAENNFKIGVEINSKPAEASAQRVVRKLSDVKRAAEQAGRALDKSLKSNVKHFNDLSKASEATTKNYDKLSRSTQKFNNETRKTSTEIGGVDRGFRSTRGSGMQMVGTINALSAAFSALALGAIGKSIFEASLLFQRFSITMEAATGSVEKAATSLEFVRAATRSLGSDLRVTAPQFAQFAVAAETANVNMEDTQKIFSSVVGAMTVMGRSSHDVELSLLALQQMMSKGVVQTEELRRQLGERMPGAVNLMAKALNVSTAELADMMKQGQVLSEVALPKFAEQVEKKFGAQLAKALERPDAQLNLLKTSFLEFQQVVGNAGFTQALSSGFREIRQALEEMTKSGRAEEWGKRLAEVTSTLARGVATIIENIDLLIAAFAALAAGPALSFMSAMSVRLLTIAPAAVAVGTAFVVMAKQIEGGQELLDRAKDSVNAFLNPPSAERSMLAQRLRDVRTAFEDALASQTVVGFTAALKQTQTTSQQLEQSIKKWQLQLKGASSPEEIKKLNSLLTDTFSHLDAMDRVASILETRRTDSIFKQYGKEIREAGEIGAKTAIEVENLLKALASAQARDDMKATMAIMKDLRDSVADYTDISKLLTREQEKLIAKALRDMPTGLTRAQESFLSVGKAVDTLQIKIDKLSGQGGVISRHQARVEALRNANKDYADALMALENAEKTLESAQENKLSLDEARLLNLQRMNDETQKSIDLANKAVLAATKLRASQDSAVMRSQVERGDLSRFSSKRFAEGFSAGEGPRRLDQERAMRSLDQEQQRANVAASVASQQAALSERIRGVNEDIKAQQVLMQKDPAQKARASQAISELSNQAMSLNSEYAKLNSLIPNLTKEQEAQNRAFERSHTIMGGMESAVQEYQDNIKTMGESTKDTMLDVFDSIEDSLTEFVMTGKISFKDLSDSIISEMMRAMIIKPLVSAAGDVGESVFSALFNADGNAFSGTGVHAFANGGTFTNSLVSSPTAFKFANGGGFNLGVMGEAGPEAVMPLKRDSSGKLGVSASGGSGGGTIVQIIDQRSSDSEPAQVRERQGPDGKKILEVLIKETVDNNIRSGAHDKALGQTFGLNRQGARR